MYGHLIVPGATRTAVFYAHYDGQPVSPADWSTPAWTPVLRSGTLEAGAPVPGGARRARGQWPAAVGQRHDLPRRRGGGRLQHAASENLRLQNLWDGVEIYGVLLARLGPEWDRAEADRTTPR